MLVWNLILIFHLNLFCLSCRLFSEEVVTNHPLGSSGFTLGSSGFTRVVDGFGGSATHVVVGEADEDALAGLVLVFRDGLRELVGGVVAVIPEAVGEEVSVGVVGERFVLGAHIEVADARVGLATVYGLEE